MNDMSGAANGAKRDVLKLSWTSATRKDGGTYRNVEDPAAEGFVLADRGSSPQVVGVFKPGDYRLKVFVEQPGQVARHQLAIHGGRPGPVRAKRDHVVVRFGDVTALAALFGETAAEEAARKERSVLDLTKPAPERDRSGVPVPSEPGKLPHCLWYNSKRHGCTVLSRWVGRIPEQFHRHRKAPVLEIRGKCVYAYGTHIDKVMWFLNGLDLRFKPDPMYRSEHEDRFLTEAMTPGQLSGIRSYEPPRKVWKPPVLSEKQIEARIATLTAERGLDYLDACVESRFAPNPKADYLPWQGDTSDWPEWMEATSVTVTPQSTGGSWHCVEMHAPGVVRRGYPPVRLNDVWLLTMPGGSDPSSGKIMGLCDPADLEEVRSYGRDPTPGADLRLPNEPIPVLTRRALKGLSSLLRTEKYGPGLPGSAFYPWEKAVKTWQDKTTAMAGLQGQVDFHARNTARLDGEADRLQGLVRSHYAKRKPAYRDYTIQDWLAEQEDGKYVKPRAWWARAEECRQAAMGSLADHDRLKAAVEAAREAAGEAAGKIEELNDEWADLVVLLHPA